MASATRIMSFATMSGRTRPGSGGGMAGLRDQNGRTADPLGTQRVPAVSRHPAQGRRRNSDPLLGPTKERVDPYSPRASSRAGRGTRSCRRMLQSPRGRPCVLRHGPLGRLSMRMGENVPPLGPRRRLEPADLVDAELMFEQDRDAGSLERAGVRVGSGIGRGDESRRGRLAHDQLFVYQPCRHSRRVPSAGTDAVQVPLLVTLHGCKVWRPR